MESLPSSIKHEYAFDLELSTENADGQKCYRCTRCKTWTANPDYHAICPARERRMGNRRKYADRRKHSAPTASRP